MKIKNKNSRKKIVGGDEIGIQIGWNGIELYKLK